MGKKLEKRRDKRVLEYVVEEKKHPRTGKRTKLPRIVDMPTAKMEDLINKGIQQGYFREREHLVLADFRTMMSLVIKTLEEGTAVNLDGYMRLEPYLTGNVNASGKTTKDANPLALKVKPLKKLKLEYTDYEWRLKGDRIQKG